MDPVQFDATIEAAGRGGCYVAVPPDALAALGGGGRIPVQATFDGLAYRGSVVSMGGGKAIGILKDIRSQLGKEPGDQVTVTLVPDLAGRTVEVAPDLQSALDDAGLADRFAALSFTHRREHVRYIDEAKKAETRARRIAKTVERLGS